MRLLQFVILALIARYLWRVAAGWLEAEARKSVAGSRPESVRPGEPGKMIYKGHMVRDPVCGLHLPESRAVTDRKDGQLHHFCSAKCRDEFLRAAG